MELRQLDIFNLTEEEILENSESSQPAGTLVMMDSIDEIVTAYETGDLVKLVFPTEEQDFELYNYLEHYYSHLKNKKGRIIQVMPYKNLQYLLEFDVKHEDKQLIMYHTYLEWIGKS